MCRTHEHGAIETVVQSTQPQSSFLFAQASNEAWNTRWAVGLYSFLARSFRRLKFSRCITVCCLSKRTNPRVYRRISYFDCKLPTRKQETEKCVGVQHL